MLKNSLARRVTLYASTAALLVGLFPATGAQAAQAADLPTLDSATATAFADQYFTADMLKEHGVPGAAFVVVKDGQVVLEKGYGYANVEAKTPVDPQKTVFRTASVSKVFTATGVMQLAEQGKIDLHTDINDYLDFEIKHLENQPITMHHLLTHTTGWQGIEPTPDQLSADPDQEYLLADHIKSKEPKVVRLPGTAMMYDNYASSLQGYIVERVSGQKFSAYMEKNVFSPLGMDRTSFRLTPEIRRQLATGYNADGSPITPYGLKPTDLPEGGLNATASDVGKFMNAHLNNGLLGDRRILSEATAKQMHRFQFGLHEKTPEMAYGFEASMYPQTNGQTVIGKGGDMPGFSSYMWLLPEQKSGAFVIYNTLNDSLRAELFSEFMNTFYPAPTLPDPNYLNTPKADLVPFEGTYRDLRMNALLYNIKATDPGTLSLRNDTFGVNMTLRQVEPLLFLAVENKGETAEGDAQTAPSLYISFAVDEDGNVTFAKSPGMGDLERVTPTLYPDVDPESPYAEFIYDLQNRGLIHGNPEGTFGPEDRVTRAEFAKLLAAALGHPGSKSPAAFADANASFAGEQIQALYELGLIKGTSATAFSPNADVSREEAATMIYRLWLLTGGKPLTAQVTGDTSPWASEAVQTIVALQFYGPDVLPENGVANYRSKQAMTRQEVAVLFSKMLNYKPQ
ncbi:beta-lactamase family protein [Tumebacillus sp. DT12]|uniref:Beta-lactamase family protein n=1 Tax=Tumebacillus lacus TaxID=2995335 RepID=A0ABT3X278_9BACL|nr:beta-lactamase family protein [Tumebacillus lacus]MCX7569721.1 beta-lactamase family protein [Tumebacillus lacus]